MTKGLREVEGKHRGERESGANSAFDEKDLPMFYLPVLATPDSICPRCSCSLENPHVRGPTWSLLIPHPIPPVLGRYPLAKPTHGLQLALKLTKNGGMSEGMIGYP